LEALSRVLDCVPIAIPPLRERAGEIRKLTEYFVGWFCEQYGSRLQFTGRAMQALQEYSWPGNVRELENLVECLALTGENVEVGLPDLPPYLAAGSTALATLGNGCEDSLWAIERRSVISALERNYWIQSRAARELGITLRQMGYRVKKYGLEDLVKSNKRRLLTHSGKVQRQHQAGMSPR
jgi:Nif-specific regulatory protein